MPTGFQVINDNGFIQIDEFYRNMVLVQKGTLTTTRPGGAGIEPYYQASYTRISYPVSSREPIFALRCNSSSNGYGVTFLSRSDGFDVFSTGSATFEYFIFDRIDFGNASGNVGMQVFNENGVEVFNSNNNYMKVLGSYDINLVRSQPANNTQPDPTTSASFPTGRKIAVAMGVQSTGWWQSITGGSGSQGSPGALVVRWWQSQILTPSNNSYKLTNGIINVLSGVIGGSPSETGIVASYNSGLILDVTGL